MYLKLIRNILCSFLFIISFSFISLTQENNEKVFVEHKHVSLQLISSVESKIFVKCYIKKIYEYMQNNNC